LCKAICDPNSEIRIHETETRTQLILGIFHIYGDYNMKVTVIIICLVLNNNSKYSSCSSIYWTVLLQTLKVKGSLLLFYIAAYSLMLAALFIKHGNC